MSDPLRWPALAGFTGAIATGCRRGIWGKVHGEASDFRWIARSAGFGADCPELAGALRIGNESVPVTGVLWRRLPDRWLACSVYPSRARDMAGRLTVVEKQIAEWRPSTAVPAAVGALILLPEIARFGDRDWWDRCSRGYWQQPDYALDIADEDCPTVVADTEMLAARIDEARRGLVAALDGDALRRYFGRLLDGRFPARLQGPGDGAKLAGGALAALLLPLPRPWADRLSLAGAVASNQPNPRDLIRNWDGYISATGVEADSDLEPEVASLADTMVAALLDGDPERLRGPKAAKRARPAPDGSSSESTWWSDDTPREIPCVSTPLDGLSEPALEAAPVVRLIHDFARDPGARRLDLSELGAAMDGAPSPELIDPQSASALCAWPREVEASRSGMDPDEKRLKVDQLRAVAALLLPDPQRVESPGLPREPTIPGLLPALALTPEKGGPRLLRLGEGACIALLEQSLACPHPILRKKTIDWIEAWCSSREAPPWAGVADLVRTARV